MNYSFLFVRFGALRACGVLLEHFKTNEVCLFNAIKIIISYNIFDKYKHKNNLPLFIFV